MDEQAVTLREKKSISGILAGLALLAASGGAILKLALSLSFSSSNLAFMANRGMLFSLLASMQVFPQAVTALFLLLAAVFYLVRPKLTGVLCLAAIVPMLVQASLMGTAFDGLLQRFQSPDVITICYQIFRFFAGGWGALAWVLLVILPLLTLSPGGQRLARKLWVLPGVFALVSAWASSLTFNLLTGILDGVFHILPNVFLNELVPIWLAALPLILALFLAGYYIAHPIKHTAK